MCPSFRTIMTTTKRDVTYVCFCHLVCFRRNKYYLCDLSRKLLSTRSTTSDKYSGDKHNTLTINSLIISSADVTLASWRHQPCFHLFYYMYGWCCRQSPVLPPATDTCCRLSSVFVLWRNFRTQWVYSARKVTRAWCVVRTSTRHPSMTSRYDAAGTCFVDGGRKWFGGGIWRKSNLVGHERCERQLRRPRRARPVPGHPFPPRSPSSRPSLHRPFDTINDTPNDTRNNTQNDTFNNAFHDNPTDNIK